MKTFAERLVWARERKGLTQGELAQASGVGQSAIGNYEAGIRKSSREYVALADALGVVPLWLAKGKGPRLLDENVLPGPSAKGELPLITWVRAGELCESPRPFADGDADEWFACPVPHGPDAYCLEVAGESMDDGTADGYRDGEILFVDPSVEAQPGHDVIVCDPNGKTTFKRLKRDTEGLYLLALNGKKIVHVPEGTVFCGVVIFSGARRGLGAKKKA